MCCCPLQHNELLALVSQQEAARGGEAGKINWTQVGMLLGRDPSDAVKEYKALRATTVRHGVFTSEEDNVIIQRFVEWQQCHPDKPGLWVALAKELNRMDKRISERWRHVLQKRLNMVDGQIDLSNMYRDAGRGRRADSHIATSPGSDAAQDSEGSMRLLETGAAQTLQELSRRAQRKRTIEELKAEHKVLYSGVKRWTQSMVSHTLYSCVRLLRRAAARLAISPLCFSCVVDGDHCVHFALCRTSGCGRQSPCTRGTGCGSPCTWASRRTAASAASAGPGCARSTARRLRARRGCRNKTVFSSI
jgi:hypothetical protein